MQPKTSRPSRLAVPLATLLIFAGPAATLASLSGCGGAVRAAPQPTEPAVPVRLAPVAPGPVDRPVRASGLVATKDGWDLSFKVGGVVAAVAVREGERVARGQVLARLDVTELAAGVRQAREGLDKARRDADRLERLAAGDAVPRAAAEDSRTALAVAEAQLAAAEFNLRRATIVAPDDGWVEQRLAEPGEIVAPGRPILRVAGEGRGFVVRAALADRDVLGLRPGTPAAVTLDAAPGRSLHGRVSEIARAAGRGTGTYHVEIALDRADGAGLLSGLTAKVEIARTVDAPASVPLAAVVDGDGETGAVFAVEHGVARRVPIRIAFLHGDRAVLAADLGGVGAVVAEGAARLAQGTRVQVVE